ncbi:MAG TPA: putative metalloprotease CJM1_0395 family protein [Chitinolyticbacter sp.]|nr:putative metalloprotease CJM1_0395 family protein [Chitinolyticbacter sp.]
MEIGSTTSYALRGPDSAYSTWTGLGTSSSRYASTASHRSTPNQELSPQDEALLQSLAQTDRQVRAHEQAHLAAASGLAMSGASFELVTGPDGQRYAVAGEVRIDLSPGNTPEETLRKARVIQAAALAPADPSNADRAIAAQGRAMELQAQAELAQQSTQQRKLGNAYDNGNASGTRVVDAAA